MNEYLLDLVHAFNNIPLFYRSRETQLQPSYYIYDQGIERTFMCELYHRWKVIMYKKLANCQNLYLQATIGKRIIGEGTVWFPDLVLHTGQAGNPLEGNKVFIEIKMENYDSEDVMKIFSGLHFLHYEVGVYIVANSNNAKMYDFVFNNYQTDFQQWNNHFDRFYFLTFEDGLISLHDLAALGNLNLHQ